MKRTAQSIERIGKIGPYRILKDAEGFILADSIGFTYGQRRYATEQEAIAYANRLMRAEDAQRRELSL